MQHADIGSDHNLLISKVKLRLRKAKTGSTINKRVAIENLKDPATKQDFCFSLRNRFNTLQNETAMTIDSFNETLMRTSIECIGYKKKARKEWITDSTWKSIEERKKLKTKILETKSPRLKERISNEYREKDKEIKTSARRDKKIISRN